MDTYDVIIVGAGPAGLTAGIYTSRAGLKTSILEKEFPGGRLAKAPLVENYPGVLRTSGAELVETMVQQAERFGAEIKTGENVADLELKGEKIVKTIEGGVYKALALIISIGTYRRKLLVPGEEEYLGSGVSYCAVCDGPFFKDRIIAVIGSGKEAGEEALMLSELGREVILIPQGSWEMEQVLLEELKKKENVKLLDGMKVEEIKGDSTVKSIVVVPLEGEGKEEILVDGVFISLGAVPMSSVIKKAGVKVDNRGCIVVDRNQRTNVEGVFAAGDCTCGGMQIVTAAGEGALAGIRASAYVKRLKRGGA
jgi:thioredoxin reductase (NADPH)